MPWRTTRSGRRTAAGSHSRRSPAAIAVSRSCGGTAPTSTTSGVTCTGSPCPVRTPGRPDGQWIYFSADDGSASHVFRANVATRSSQQLTGAGLAAYATASSPDGSTIAFIVDADYGFDLWVAASDGTGAHRILESAGLGGWSSDGQSSSFGGSPRTTRSAVSGRSARTGRNCTSSSRSIRVVATVGTSSANSASGGARQTVTGIGAASATRRPGWPPRARRR